MISFGVAPASLPTAAACRACTTASCWPTSSPAACRGWRATTSPPNRYPTASGKVTHFEGTPIPTSILLVGVLALAAWSGAVREHLWFGEVVLAGFKLHPLVLMFGLSGSLMISRIRIPKR